jgi:hypothetical protein
MASNSSLDLLLPIGGISLRQAVFIYLLSRRGNAMSSIRVRTTVEEDGELHLRGLPLRKGDEAEIIVLTEPSADAILLGLLEQDPGWRWLKDPAEDIYTEADAT